MKITIKFGAGLRRKVTGLVDGELQVELAAGSRVVDAITAVGLETTDVRVIMLTGRPVLDNVELHDGDRLAMFPPELAFNMYVAINFYNHLLES